jgi:hypothetical protein
MRIGHRQDPSRSAIRPIRIIKPIGTGDSTGNVRLERLPLFASDAKRWEPSFWERRPLLKGLAKISNAEIWRRLL